MRRTMLVLAAVAAAMLVAGGAALAANTINCTFDQRTCEGTEGDDNIYGLDGTTFAYGLGGDDRIYGREGDDALTGDCPSFGSCPSEGGDDKLYGEQGEDSLSGDLGSDLLVGGSRHDVLTTGTGGDDGPDVLHGGGGADLIGVADGAKDTVYCGPPAVPPSPRGKVDEVTFDEGLDVISEDCEIQNPR